MRDERRARQRGVNGLSGVMDRRIPSNRGKHGGLTGGKRRREPDPRERASVALGILLSA